MYAPEIRNSKGKIIRLSDRELRIARINQRKCNDLGYDIPITALTTIMKKISEQKFYQIPFADYFPVRAGQGAWSLALTTYRSFEVGGEFEKGIVNTGQDNARLASANTAIDSLTIQVFNWAKSMGWTLMDIQHAAKAGNWDLIEALEISRKTNYDLGLQRIAFLGANGLNGSSNPKCLGLLNQQGITTNTTIIPTYISDMVPSALKTFTAQIVESYRANNQRTAWPDRFIIPESDYNGLASQASPDFPIKSTLQLLEEAFQTVTRNKAFQILPLAYADIAYHTQVASIAGVNVYTLLRYDESSIRMDVPVPYTNTLANSLDNFSFQNVGYSQFTGALAYRPRELMYFTNTATS